MTAFDTCLQEPYQEETKCYCCKREIEDEREDLICDDCESEKETNEILDGKED